MHWNWHRHIIEVFQIGVIYKLIFLASYNLILDIVKDYKLYISKLKTVVLCARTKNYKNKIWILILCLKDLADFNAYENLNSYTKAVFCDKYLSTRVNLILFGKNNDCIKNIWKRLEHKSFWNDNFKSTALLKDIKSKNYF